MNYYYDHGFGNYERIDKDNLEAQGTAIRNLADEMLSQYNKLRGILDEDMPFWRGNSGNAFRKTLKDIIGDIKYDWCEMIDVSNDIQNICFCLKTDTDIQMIYGSDYDPMEGKNKW